MSIIDRDSGEKVANRGFMENSARKDTNIADHLANNTIGTEKITISSAAISLASVQKENAVRALITVENGDMRVKTDGSAPTQAEGMLIKEGYLLELVGNKEILDFKAIRKADVDVVLNITYYN